MQRLEAVAEGSDPACSITYTKSIYLYNIGFNWFEHNSCLNLFVFKEK